MAATASLRLAIVSAEYRPCFQFAFRLRASPSGVRGPVLAPPCIRQRPFLMAAPLQEPPRRVRAPHRGAALANFRRLRRVGVSGLFFISSHSPRLSPLTSPPLADLRCNHRLAALGHMHVLHCHDLATARPNALQGNQPGLIGRR